MKANCSLGKCNGDDQPVYIEIIDEDSRARIRLELNHLDFTNMMTGLNCVPCEMTIRGQKNIGLVMERKEIEFEVSCKIHDRKEDAIDLLIHLLLWDDDLEGWSSTEIFDRKSSFFKRDGKQFARATIQRWVERSEGGE